jgi:hypothetical protein
MSEAMILPLSHTGNGSDFPAGGVMRVASPLTEFTIRMEQGLDSGPPLLGQDVASTRLWPSAKRTLRKEVELAATVAGPCFGPAHAASRPIKSETLIPNRLASMNWSRVVPLLDDKDFNVLKLIPK